MWTRKLALPHVETAFRDTRVVYKEHKERSGMALGNSRLGGREDRLLFF